MIEKSKDASRLSRLQVCSCLILLGKSLLARGMMPVVVVHDPNSRCFHTRLGAIPELAVLSATYGDNCALDNWMIWLTMELNKN